MPRGDPEQMRKINAAYTTEDRRKNGIKGGYASGEARRRQRTFRESVRAILSGPVDAETAKKLEAFGIDGTMLDAITAAVANRALLKGDPEAYKTLRDTIGEAPTQVHEVKLDAGAELREATTEQLESLLDE